MWCRLDPCEGQAWAAEGRCSREVCVVARDCQVRGNQEFVSARGTYDRSDRSDRSTERDIPSIYAHKRQR